LDERDYNKTLIVGKLKLKAYVVVVRMYRDRITLAVLELRENEDLAKLERNWWYEQGEAGEELVVRAGRVRLRRNVLEGRYRRLVSRYFHTFITSSNIDRFSKIPRQIQLVVNMKDTNCERSHHILNAS